MFVCFLIIDHEHSHKKNKRKHWRKQWVESSLLSDTEMLKHSLEVNPFSADSNETGNVSEKKSHRRTKRFLSYPRFVEVMVVADSRMVAYHGANLQHYVLTLMSIVSIQLGREVHPLCPKILLWAEFLCDTSSLPQLGMEIMPRSNMHCLTCFLNNIEYFFLKQVASIYKDPSIGNLINIVIVKLVVIHNEQVMEVVFFSFCLQWHL